MGIDVVIGDAMRTDVLKRARVVRAKAVGITVPDPAVAQRVTAQVRALTESAAIVVRSRYHRYNEDLCTAGANSVSDEETLAGSKVASEIKMLLREQKVDQT